MYRDLLLIFIVVCCLTSDAQDNKTAFAQAFSRHTIPDSAQQNINDLTGYINRTYHSDSDKVAAIFLWMAINIKYDDTAYYNKNIIPNQQIPTNVFLHKTGVCEGYANLFQYLCENAAITSHKIDGYAKGLGYYKDRLFDFDRLGHAWNAVKLENQWFLMDVTWAASSLQEHDTADMLYYYKANPRLFLSSHFPEDPMWQLQFHPLGFEQWRHSKYEYFVPGFNDTLLNFPLLLDEYETLSPNQQKLASFRRYESFSQNIPERIFDTKDSNNNMCNRKAEAAYEVSYVTYRNYVRTVHASTNYASIGDSTWEAYKGRFVQLQQEIASAKRCYQTNPSDTLNMEIKGDLNNLDLWFDREIKCINQYISHPKFNRKHTPFYSYGYPFFREHPYTQLHRNELKSVIDDSMEIYLGAELLFPCIPTYNFSQTGLLFGIGLQVGYRHRNALYTLQLQGLTGTAPTYNIKIDNQIKKANINGTSLIMVGVEQYLYVYKRTECFLSGKLGFSALGQYYDKEYNSKALKSYSSVLSIGAGCYYRSRKYTRNYRFNLQYCWLFHDADGVSNLNGGLILVGVAYGVGGNKK